MQARCRRATGSGGETRLGKVGHPDIRLRYTPARAPWTLEAFATNLADTRYLVSAGDGGQNFGLPTYLYGSPRLVGVRFEIQMPG